MKPEWCPQWAWDEAWEVTSHHWASDTGYRRAMAIYIARALLDSHQRGRREGMEEAAKVADEYVWDDHALAQATAIGKACHHQSIEIADAIRAKA